MKIIFLDIDLPLTRNKDGFNQHYFEIVKSMLEKTVIELNYTQELDTKENI